jgi:endonuclease/exonuclease/phosphatase family metal-dependent hydrolase
MFAVAEGRVHGAAHEHLSPPSNAIGADQRRQPDDMGGQKETIMTRKTHLVVLPAALFGMLVAVGSARAAYPVCPAKSFTIHSGKPGSPIAAGTQFTVGDGQAALGNGCPATTARIRGTKKGTRVTARWTSCPGVGRMRIKGMIDKDTCGTFTGGVVVANPPWKDIIVATAAKGDAADAVRIGTYNVQFLSGILGRWGSPCLIGKGDNDDYERPKVIADRVKASGYDIIAFNEVFDATAQERLVEEMKGTYPHYVEKLDLDTSNQEDSGLMIFSRWEFVAFDNPPTKSGACWATDCDKVAVRDYSACDDSDCLASKGVALVRIKNPQTDRIYNVAFTHTQAFYPPESLDDAKVHVDTRRSQFLNIMTLINDNLSIDQQEKEELIVMGDLNVDGDYADADLGYDAVNFQNLYEYNERMNNSAVFPDSYFSIFLRDQWDEQNLPLAIPDKDRGTTNDYVWPGDSDQAARLDYILRHPEPGPGDPGYETPVLCGQHMFRSYNLRANPPFSESAIGEPGSDGGSCDLSDHVGVTLDLNLWAPQCDPQHAKVMQLAEGAVHSEPGAIQYAAGMQWFRFDQPGTYGFAVDSNNDNVEDDDLHFQVYESTDLSTPIGNYKEKTVVKGVKDDAGEPYPQTLKVYAMPKAPFYVKVFDPDRTFHDAYRLNMWRAACTSKEEACVLLPTQGQTHDFPAGKPLNATDTAWYEFDTESTGGAAQHLEFGAYIYVTNLLSVEWRAADGTTVLGSNSSPVMVNNYWKNEMTAATPDANTHYLLVKRNDPTLTGIQYMTRWTTDLSMLVGDEAGAGATKVKLYVGTKTDDIGSDEIYLTVYADGVPVMPEKYVGNLGNAEPAGLDWLPLPIKFVNQLKFVFREDDDAPNEDELIEFVIKPLDRDSINPCLLNRMPLGVVTQGTDLPTDVIEYWLHYNLCHGIAKK